LANDSASAGKEKSAKDDPLLDRAHQAAIGRTRAFEDDAKILERIASQYDDASTEHAALKRAAIALWYVSTTNYEAFKDYVSMSGADLTPEQRSYLTAMGIDPDRDSD
jgi:hypothetical protein